MFFGVLEVLFVDLADQVLGIVLLSGDDVAADSFAVLTGIVVSVLQLLKVCIELVVVYVLAISLLMTSRLVMRDLRILTSLKSKTSISI